LKLGPARVAWLQISHQKLRLLAAVLGVAFAVVLIFVQLGFQQALYDSSVRWHTALGYDLAVISPRATYIVNPPGFPRNRLYQTLGFAGVDSVTPVYTGIAKWRNPEDPLKTRNIYVMGFDPMDSGFALAGDRAQLSQLRIPDRVLFDRSSRPEFGPIAGLLEGGEKVTTEINGRDIKVIGLYDLGLVRLEPGAEAAAVRDRIVAGIPGDVRVLTRALANSPKMILADEPTASLDKESGRNVVNLIQTLCREQGASVVMVTHDNRILDVADRILHLEDGEIQSMSAAVASSTSQMLKLLNRHDPDAAHYMAAFSQALTRVAMADDKMDDHEREAIRRILVEQSDLQTAEVDLVMEWRCHRCVAAACGVRAASRYSAPSRAGILSGRYTR
jgi:hypothetical protein